MKESVRRAGYLLDLATNTWLRPDYQDIAYSDGDEAEDRIATVIQQTSDLSVLSPELRQHCSDWVSLYHLGANRANIMRPFRSALDGDVLEIGAGCGAITRYLGECGANVLALEGSRRRAAIARARTRDLPDVTVLAEKFEQFQSDLRFDVITLIGVLEYAGLFAAEENPQLAMLERARSLLKPEGKLIVAIENQLGLKYFAGAPEDHLGLPMYGIEGRYRANQPQTFGRAVLTEMLDEAGFSVVEFLSPLPDYKLPISILTAAGLGCEGFDASAFAWQSARRDPQLPPLLNFSPELVWPPVFANDLALALANSFLIVSTPRGQKPIQPHVLAFHYSTERKPEFCKETVFKRDESGAVRIEYNRLGEANCGADGSPLVRFVCPSSDEYSLGKPLSVEFVQIVSRDGWSIEEVAHFLARYVEFLGTIARDEGARIDIDSPYSLVPGTFFDAVPQNLIVRDDGRVSLIDREWELHVPIELGHLLFRTLLQLIGAVTRFGTNSRGQIMTRRQFVDGVLQAANLGLTTADFDRYLEIEEQITEQVIGCSAAGAVRWWPEHPLPTLGLSQAVAERDAELASARHAISIRDDQIIGFSQAAVALKKRIASLNRRLVEHEVRIESTERTLAERDQHIESIRRSLAERDTQVESIGRVVAERDTQIATLGETLTGLNCQVADFQRTCAEQGSRIAELNGVLVERERDVARLDRQMSERDARLSSLEDLLSGREKQIAELRVAASALEARIRELLTSNSWRMTEPLRGLRRTLISRPYRQLRKLISDGSRTVWHRLPVSSNVKQRLKNALFRNFPSIFEWSMAYRSWECFRRPIDSSFPDPRVDSTASANDETSRQYVGMLAEQPPRDPQVTVIAFYLPQFHAIPENDAWWGPGFTEWANVKPAVQQFDGHYQPHVPGELGYYDLGDRQVLRRQVELAQLYGIGGFCFYFYWFGGKTLLEQPIRDYHEDASLSLPFCICWANENWNRRWDGLDNDILIAQQHSPQDDLAFIAHVSQYLRDRRYIRVDGRPLLVVYRPSGFPAPTETAVRWRTWCRENGIGDLFLAYTQSFEIDNPNRYGFDAAIEFPPNNSSPPNVTSSVEPLRSDFACAVYDWNVFVERSFSYKDLGYPLFRSVCPSWDNTARRKNAGTVFLNSNPSGYRTWLENAIEDTCVRFPSRDARLVFVNAWNEWAEGAHLEPDARYGYAWLQATRDALDAKRSLGVENLRRALVVTHDAYPHGAQYLALRIAQDLPTSLGCEIEVVCLGDGPLKGDFAKSARLHDLSGIDPQGREARELANALYRRGFHHAIVNTTVCGLFLSTLKQAGMRCVGLVHELPELIRSHRLEPHAKRMAEVADKVVFPAAAVRDAYFQFASIDADKVVVRPQGLYKRNPFAGVGSEPARRSLRHELGISDDARIVLAVGYADKRKGAGYFLEIAETVVGLDSSVHFVWVGHWDTETQPLIDDLRQNPQGLSANTHFVGRRDDTSTYYAGADVFALTSREDPFPSVALEAMDVGLPIVAFAGSGGVEELICLGVGVTAPMGNTAAFAKAILGVLSDSEAANRMSTRGRALISERFSFRHYLFDLLSFLEIPLRKISVVVPNFNYQRYLPERLGSIFAQTYPVYEIVFLDDASTDESVAIGSAALSASGIDHRLAVNGTNSGSPFRQWMRGATMARGDFVWIAEADDVSNPRFLETVIRGFDDPRVAMSYCQSRQIDQDGFVLADSYQDYVADLGNERWSGQFVNDGCDEICRYLAVKNTIPNVSAVLFGRQKLARVLTECIEDVSKYRVAGDWKTYLHLLSDSWLAYFPQPLNDHRRHRDGVTIGSFDAEQFAEIEDIQNWVDQRFAVGGETRETARRYLKNLSRQFGVRLDQKRLRA